MVTTSSALDRFRGPDGVCSVEVATDAGVVLLPSALASTVASTGLKLKVSSTREQYGHLVTSAVAKLQPDNRKSSYPYFGHPTPDHGADRRHTSFTKWNPTAPSKAGHLERLESLRSDPMLGYLLVVARHWDAATASYGEPILRLVAAPSMMTSDTPVFTYGSNDRVEGFTIADDIWSPPPAFAATSGEPLSLLVAAGGGTFRDGKSSASPHEILTSTDALIFLSAIDIADSATIAGTTIWRSWYLPLGCNAPIGLTWKLDGLSFEDITDAATALCSKSAE
jgi:hypothetical protein